MHKVLLVVVQCCCLGRSCGHQLTWCSVGPPNADLPIKSGPEYVHKLQNYLNPTGWPACTWAAQGCATSKTRTAPVTVTEHGPGVQLPPSEGPAAKESDWEGSFTILQQLSYVVYQVSLQLHQREVVVHVDHLAQYQEALLPDVQSPLPSSREKPLRPSSSSQQAAYPSNESQLLLASSSQQPAHPSSSYQLPVHPSHRRQSLPPDVVFIGQCLPSSSWQLPHVGNKLTPAAVSMAEKLHEGGDRVVRDLQRGRASF